MIVLNKSFFLQLLKFSFLTKGCMWLPSNVAVLHIKLTSVITSVDYYQFTTVLRAAHVG